MAADRHTIVVALANPDTVGQLLRTASDLARRHDGRVHAVTVEHKPVSSPFRLFTDDRVAAEFADGGHEVLEQASAASDVPLTTDLLVDTDVAAAIREAVDAVDADTLLVGWREPPRASDVVLGTTVDPLVRRPPCDLLLERVGPVADGVDRVLVPTVGGPHVGLAADIAESVAVANGARVTLLSVVPIGAGDGERIAARETIRETAQHLSAVPTDHRVIESPTSASGILEAAADHDLVVLGATGTGRIRPPVIGSVAKKVGGEVTCPVVIAKRPTASWIDRALTRLRP